MKKGSLPIPAYFVFLPSAGCCLTVANTSQYLSVYLDEPTRFLKKFSSFSDCSPRIYFSIIMDVGRG